MSLRAAIQRFRATVDEATTSGSIATTIQGGRPLRGATDTSNLGFLTDKGNPFYGRKGLKQIERERRARMKRKKKCKGYDPACRDKEWEVPAPTGGVALLRRSKIGEGLAEAKIDSGSSDASREILRQYDLRASRIGRARHEPYTSGQLMRRLRKRRPRNTQRLPGRGAALPAPAQSFTTAGIKAALRYLVKTRHLRARVAGKLGPNEFADPADAATIKLTDYYYDLNEGPSFGYTYGSPKGGE